MVRYLIPSSIAVFLAVSPASALPSAAGAVAIANAAPSDLVTEVQDRGRDRRDWRDRRRDRRDSRRDRHRNRHGWQDRHHRHRFAPGSRHRHAPRGWRRYHTRPWDWRDRGCIVVGPLWFCP